MARSARIHASAASALVETPPTYDKGKPGATRGRKATGLAANATVSRVAKLAGPAQAHVRRGRR